jgi:holo-[acyl-carrier protein] synthase
VSILGTGVDLERVERLQAAIERHGQRFLDRVFTADEIAFVEGKKNRYERYAARFAAKEAAMKALGTGWAHGIRWVDIEVFHEPGGRPGVRFYGRAAEFAAQMGCQAVHVSLSHTSDNAIAQVILEGPGR